MLIKSADKIDATVERILSAARIPGAALAIVAGEKMVFAKGYGYRDLDAKLPLTSETIYPIASTTKAINATLLGMLVDEGRLGWDVPVQNYLPRFRLRDPAISTQVTLRDLITMRTGLPRHDWMWSENSVGRAELVDRLRFLEPSAGFRERYQYNNLTVTAAGHVAEVVTGQSWEDLARERIFGPLGMSSSAFALPNAGNTSLSYHETRDRQLIATRRLTAEVTAPSGGAIQSTVEDLARWVAFNLSDGVVAGRRLIRSQTFAEIRSPQIVIGPDQNPPSPGATYAMGWFVDKYNRCTRVAHGGYIHDVNSEVTLFPEHGIGIVSFNNFGCPTLARLVNQHVFDVLVGFEFAETLEEKLEQYERKIAETCSRNAAVRRVENTSPSHPVELYAGVYAHAAYGNIEIRLDGGHLIFQRNRLSLPLEHWHYDAWIAGDNEFFSIHLPHAFERASRLMFETNADGDVAAVSIRLEPTVAPIRFERVVG